MRRALRLARRGERWVSPNPMVGAVIVKENRIIGEGYHRKFGEAHAEVNALIQAGTGAEGATIYVTLEPCCHYGKTPPCVDSLIAAKIKRVVVGTKDLNPLVSGKGISILREAGVEVTVGILEEACRSLNERFFKYITSGFPFITLKYAQTIDGRIATVTGDARFISSFPALRYAHYLRSIHDAVLVGIGTVLRDDPALTVRHIKGRNPLRVVVDTKLRISPSAQVLKEQDKAKTIIATTSYRDQNKYSILQERGIEILEVAENSSGSVDLKGLFSALGKRGVSSILVEGGSALITSLVKEQLFDRLVVIVAPKLLGTGIDALGNLEILQIEGAIKLSFLTIKRLGNDLIIDARPWPTATSGLP